MVERESELAALWHDLEKALDGQGRVVIIDGPAATGKTTLLRAFAERAAASGARVLEAAGTSAEQGVALGVLRRLVRGIDAPADMSPEALWLLEDGLLGPLLASGGLGEEGEAGPPDASGGAAPFGTTMARELAAVLLRHAETRPLVLLVDDAHIVDDVSLRWLVHLAHRLRAARITLVLAGIPAAAPCPPHLRELLGRPYCRRLRLAPLSRTGQERLLAQRVDAETAVRLAVHCDELTGGNPLLVEALLKDSDDTLRGGGELTADTAFAQAVVHLLRRAGSAASRVAEVMAVLSGPGTPAFGTHALAAKVLEWDPARLDEPAERLRGAGLLTGEGFRGPAIPALVLESMPTEDLAELHRRAALLLYAEGAPAQVVARHLVTANKATRPWSGEVLLTAAEQAMATGDSRFAVACLRLARRGDVHPRERVRVAEMLAAIEWRTDPAVAARLLPELDTAFGAGLLTERGALSLSRYLAWTGRTGAAADMVARTRPAGLIPGRQVRGRLVREAAATRLLLTTVFPDVAGRPPGGPVEGRAEGRSGGLPPDPDLEIAGSAASGQLRAAAALATALSAGAHDVPGLDPVTVAQEVLAGARPPTWSFEHVVAALATLVYAERPVLAADWCDTLLEQEAGRCAAAERAALEVVRAVAAMRTGDLTTADRRARAALAWTSPAGWGVTIGLPISVTVLATTAAGRLEEAATHLGIAVPAAMFETLAGLHYLHARGRHHLAAGRPEAALADFLACGDRMTRWGCDVPGLVPWRVEAAWSLLTLGNRDGAAALVRRQLARIGPGPSRTRGACLRILASGAGAAHRPALLTEAVRVLEQGDDQCELALALGELGQAREATGRHREARATRDVARRLGRQSGLTSTPAAPDRTHGGPDREPGDTWTSRPGSGGAGEGPSLTEAERKVAELAAEGGTNRRIAETLGVTVSTVEQHLTRVYRKLGVARRSELGSRLRPASPDDR
ncbi:AAA family ATPase [Spirillospora sp. NPDC052269]